MTRLLLATAVAYLLTVSTTHAATAYCLRGTMADGTYTRTGSLAHNGYRLGTRLWATPAVFGRHRWTVRDRIGWGSEADFWAPSCSQAISFGRRSISLTVGWRGWEARERARRRR
jgi:3D (Asp-Asp-Asp) domain-containing protein